MTSLLVGPSLGRWYARDPAWPGIVFRGLGMAAQPEGGGTVVCDDGGAELLIGGDLPIAPLRLVSEYFRARWTNVPPGKHAVRYRSGKVVEIVVEDGGEVVLPK